MICTDMLICLAASIAHRSCNILYCHSFTNTITSRAPNERQYAVSRDRGLGSALYVVAACLVDRRAGDRWESLCFLRLTFKSLEEFLPFSNIDSYVSAVAICLISPLHCPARGDCVPPL